MKTFNLSLKRMKKCGSAVFKLFDTAEGVLQKIISFFNIALLNTSHAGLTEKSQHKRQKMKISL